MKKIIFYIALFLILGSESRAGLADSTIIKKVTELATQVQKKYAPDKRTEYFQIKMQTNEPLAYTVEVSRPEAITELKNLLSTQGISVKVNGEVLPSKDLGEKIYGVANLSVSNNRYAPSHSAEMATQSILGTPVKILKKERGYYFVRTPDNYLSYSETAGITAMTKAEFEAWQSSDKIVYTDIYGQAFSDPSETSSPISDLVSGNILQLLGTANGFYKVAFPDKRTAYIPMSTAQSFSQWEKRPNPSADQILKSARTMLGVPYLWGGTSTKGVDCSGFTKTSYFLNGVVLPRDASQQALVGEKVDIYEADTVNIAKCLKNLKPGDLLFFAGDKKNMRITHTALYIGEGQFIQSAGLVRINSMVSGSANYGDFEARTLVSARRMLNSIGKPEITRVDQHPYYKHKTE
ncbi:C40 family peptidase [Daejeonella lutea]|uniref:NlpC/P60 family protein n=1 Tax=Daejeonella lutea TaxID=572036 RepID=A0A1T5DTU0_9SPHI|nr:C40 family peptidase [Daejeonella lutea]SKB74956.1 NlpC/P60 family protein [Daejeonella lutea]